MRSYDEDRSVYSGHYEVDILIDRPVRDVWKNFLDIGSWVMNFDIEEVSNPKRVLGAITRVSPKNAEETGLSPPLYHYCKIIKLVPERHYLLKTYSEKGGSYGLQVIGFDDFRFIVKDGKTKVIFNIFAEMKGEAVVKDPESVSLESSREGMAQNLNNLKRLVESH